MQFHGQTGGKMSDKIETTDQSGDPKPKPEEMSEKEKALLEEVKQLREDRRTARDEAAEVRKLFMIHQQKEQERLQNQNPSRQKEEELLNRFDPEVRTGIEAMMKRRMEEALNPMQHAMLGLMVKDDINGFKEVAGKNYGKYRDRVESEFQQSQAQGRAMPRATIYRQLRADDLDSGKIKVEVEKDEDETDTRDNLRAMGKFGGGNAPRTRQEKPSKAPDFSKMNMAQREKAVKEMEKSLADVKL